MTYRVIIKGQVTIPKRVREHLGIGPGSRIDFEIDSQGEVLLRKVGTRTCRVGARSRFAVLRGTRKTGKSTDAIMNSLRGNFDDADDPGFSKTGK